MYLQLLVHVGTSNLTPNQSIVTITILQGKKDFSDSVWEPRLPLSFLLKWDTDQLDIL